MDTICVKCGTPKRFLDEICPGCSFRPTSIEDLAKARILSEPYCFTTGSGAGFETGRSPKELEKISGDIKAGLSFEFASDELCKVKQIIRDAESTSGMDVVRDLVQFFGPALGFLAVMILILWLL